MIRKSLLISLLFMISTTFVMAKTTQINYKATFGIFGKVGTIKNRLTQNKKTYEIDTTVKLAGLAKMLMGGQTEHYVSKGHMKNGLMICDTYVMTTKKKKKKTIKEYSVNHKKKNVTKRVRKWKKGKLVEDKKEILNFYAKDDLLTLYFNMNSVIKDKGKTYMLKAVGLEKQKGKVKITVPNDSQVSSYKKDLGSSADWYAKALIVQKNFKKKKGDILLSVAKDGFIKKAVIKDVLMFGDAKLIRTK